MADKNGVYKYYNGTSYDNIYFKTKGALVEQDSTHRFMSDAEKSKLSGIEAKANNYSHPSTHGAGMIVQDSTHRFVSDAERSKLSGIEAKANNYSHPSTHGAGMIVQDSTHRFISDDERRLWNGKAGTGVATQKVNGLMSAVDKQKLDGLDGRIKSLVLNSFYPVGSIYMSTSSANPTNLVGGTWQLWGQGRVLVGVGTGSDIRGVRKTFAANEAGGEYYHTLNINEMPSHDHEQFVTANDRGGASRCDYDSDIKGQRYSQGINTGLRGGGQAHNNIQPYITCYMWRRTA